MKKILLLIICILIITGCKVEYNLVINNDLTISESVKMTGTDEFFDNYYKSSRMNVIEMMFDDYRKEDLRNGGYSYQIIDGNTPYVLASQDYVNAQDFATKTILFAQYFEDIEVYEQDGVITIETHDFIPINPDSIERYNIKTTKIDIKSSYKIVSHNASSYDEKTNTYTWYIDDETTDFSLKFAYDTNEIYQVSKNNTDLMLIIGTLLVISLVIVFAYFMNKRDVK